MSERYSNLLVENREIFIPHLYLAARPHRKWPRWNFVKMFDADKTRMIGLPYGEKNYDNMLSHFHLIPESYGQTDGRTDRIAMSVTRIWWCAIKTNNSTSMSPLSLRCLAVSAKNSTISSVISNSNSKLSVPSPNSTSSPPPSGSILAIWSSMSPAEERRFRFLARDRRLRLLRPLLHFLWNWGLGTEVDSLDCIRFCQS